MANLITIDFYLEFFKNRIEIEKKNNLFLMVFPFIILTIGVFVTVVLYNLESIREVNDVVKIGPGIFGLIIPSLQLKPILDTRARLSSYKQLSNFVNKFKSSADGSNSALPEEVMQHLKDCVTEILKK